MNQQEFEQYFRAADNKLHDFYRNSLYRMGEHPMLFWGLLVFATVGVVKVLLWAF